MTATMYANLNVIFICDILVTILGVDLGRSKTLCTVCAELVVENSIDIGDNT